MADSAPVPLQRHQEDTMALLKQTALIATALAVPGLMAMAEKDRTPGADKNLPGIRDIAPDLSGQARFQQAHPGTGFTENYGRIERVYG